ncbi:MAG TPA: Ig-like domain-containing protein, partial [Dehalococcoidia bacterium]|nr:Ig-like domain-containing protein [Dehalococcoidia bacterium]
NGQSAPGGEELPQPLEVLVRDRFGNPVAGARVTWAALTGGGTMNPAESVTDSAGRASTRWTLGLVPGTQQAAASVASLTPASFSATAVLSIEDVDVLPDTVYFRALGDTARLKARALDKKGAEWSGVVFAWGSLDPGVVSVTTDGLARARGSGVGRIVASAAGKSDTAVSVVTPQPVRVVASVEAVTLNALGDTVQLSAVAVDANGTPVPGTSLTYQSSNPSVATVDAVGRVIARAVGQALILIGAPGCVGDTVLATVRQVVAAVSVQPASASLTAGGSLQLTAAASDSNGYAVGGASFAWSSSNTAVATVNQSGVVTAVAQGSATMTASSGGKTAASSISVAGSSVLPPPVATVTVQPSSLSLTVGQTAQLGVVLKDANGNTLTGRSVTWSSSNPSVATVSASGLVTALTAGSATITATSEGKSGTAAVSVGGGGGAQSGAYPNQPAGYARIAEHSLACIPGSPGCAAIAGTWFAPWPQNTTPITDPTAPRSPSGVLQVKWPQGLVGGTGPTGWGTTEDYFGAAGAQKELYISLWLNVRGAYLGTDRWSNDFEGASKLFYIAHGIPPWKGHSTSHVNLGVGEGDGVFLSEWSLSYTVVEYHYGTPDQPGVRTLGQNRNPSKKLTCGTWHHLEIRATLNDLGRANGTFRAWLDGVLVLEYTDIGFISADRPNGFFQWWFDPVWNFAPATKDRDEYAFLDHVYISGIRQ